MRKRWGSIMRGAMFGSLLVALIAVALPVAADAGDPVRQGRTNRVDRKTVLTGSAVKRPMLKVVNTAADGIGIRITVAAGQPPIAVNSTGLVANLNADRLDGITSKDLLPGGRPPAGTTLRGTYAMGGSAGTVGDLAISEIAFGYTLGAAPIAHFIEFGATPPTACPGSATSPQAAPGHLCIYESEQVAAGLRDTNGPGGDGSTYSFGTRIFIRSAAAGDFYSMGTWATTAAAVGAEPVQLPDSGFRLGIAD